LNQRLRFGDPAAFFSGGWQTGAPVSYKPGALIARSRRNKMNVKLNAISLGGILVLSSFLSQPVKADEWNKRTEFQFSAPVEIPGKVLAPGKYVFELADSQSDRNLVRVFSEDPDGNEHLVTTIQALSDYTTNTPDKPVVHFEERPSGSPEAIQSWFYPGENTGWEFVYPRRETLGTSAD
jgi:hypothetical protein